MKQVAAVLACLAAAAATLVAGQAAPKARSILRYALSVTALTEVNPNDALAATRVWSKAVGQTVGAWDDTEARLFEDSASIVRAVNTDATDIVALSSIEYLSIEHAMRAEPFLAYEQNGSVGTPLVLLVRDGIRTIADLRNKRVGIFSGPSQRDLADTWLEVLLLEAGLDERERSLQQVRVFRKRSQAALALFFGQVDAAIEQRGAFDTAVELNPQLGRSLKVLSESPRLLPGLVCIRSSLSAPLRAGYAHGAAELYKQPNFKQTFLMLRVSRLVPWDARYLDGTRALVARYEALHRQRGR